MLQDGAAWGPGAPVTPATAAPTWIGRQVRIGRESLGQLASTRGLSIHRALSRLRVHLNSHATTTEADLVSHLWLSTLITLLNAAQPIG